MSTCREPKDCVLLREDYFECLHHSKEVPFFNPIPLSFSCLQFIHQFHVNSISIIRSIKFIDYELGLLWNAIPNPNCNTNSPLQLLWKLLVGYKK
jgi:hypothetical protein